MSHPNFPDQNPYDPNQPGQSGGQPEYGQPPAAPYGQPPASPYGAPPASPYGQPPAPYDAQPASTFDAQPYGQPPAAPYGAPSPYGAPAPMYQGGPAAAAPQNYLVWSIVATLLCCLPAGIVSIVFASQVNAKWAQGDYAGAQRSANNARTWLIVSVVVGLIATPIVFWANMRGLE